LLFIYESFFGAKSHNNTKIRIQNQAQNIERIMLKKHFLYIMNQLYLEWHKLCQSNWTEVYKSRQARSLIPQMNSTDGSSWCTKRVKYG
jgi:hypothetical protein